MANVKLNLIKKAYGATVVIPNLNLEIDDKEFIVLVGSSGSGKSTLLRLIAGLEETTSGTIEVNGEDITKSDPSDRDMAMVFQSYALYPHMTVAKNMSFALEMRKVPTHEITTSVTNAIKMLGLDGLEDRKPSQLSGGQRQRVAMGRAIVRKPSLFLFDEPLSNLDAKLRSKTRLEIRQLHDRLAATSIFVTHDQVEAMTMADRIVLLNYGEIQQVGTPNELYYHPVNKFVAGFIGSPEMNFFSGEINIAEGRISFNSNIKWDLPASQEIIRRLTEKNLTSNKITLGIRPEHFKISYETSHNDTIVKVVAVEFSGHDLYITGDLEGRKISIRTSSLENSDRKNRLKIGSQISILPILDCWHIFDEVSGQNIGTK